jgi:hypothetical protein
MKPYFGNMIWFVFGKEVYTNAKRISYEDDDGPREDPGKKDGGGDTREGDQEDVEQVANIVVVGTITAVVVGLV